MPCFDARPPDRKTRQSKREHRECADTVHFSAGWSSEQIVVQIKQLCDEPETRWDGIAKIAAAPGIEQTPPYLAATI